MLSSNVLQYLISFSKITFGWFGWMTDHKASTLRKEEIECYDRAHLRSIISEISTSETRERNTHRERERENKLESAEYRAFVEYEETLKYYICEYTAFSPFRRHIFQSKINGAVVVKKTKKFHQIHCVMEWYLVGSHLRARLKASLTAFLSNKQSSHQYKTLLGPYWEISLKILASILYYIGALI